MTDSRAKSGGLPGILAAAFGACLIASPSLAQAPMVPDNEHAPAAEEQAAPQAPLSLAPRSLSPEDRKADAAAAPRTVRQGIEAETLGAINAETVGVLSESEGGLGAAMWRGTDRALVERLLPRLPVQTPSPALHDLMTRMLLSAATVPVGEGGTNSLAHLRLQQLLRLGEATSAVKLIDAMPDAQNNPELAETESLIRFAAGEDASACGLVSERASAVNAPVYWQKALTFCQALAGENDKAALGASLLREVGEGDPLFFDLVDDLTGTAEAKIKDGASPSLLHLMMMVRAAALPPPSMAESDEPLTLRLLATGSGLSADRRIDLAERAASRGILDGDDLGRVYSANSFGEAALANALTAANDLDGPAARALLFQAARSQTVATATAELVAKAFELGLRDGRERYLAAVIGFAPILNTLQPANELAWFAPAAVRALLATGKVDLAHGWLRLLRAAALFDEVGKQELDAVMPLARLSGVAGPGEWAESSLAAWWDGQKETTGAEEKAGLLFALVEALGEPVPEGLWRQLLGGPATTEGRTAEAVFRRGLKAASGGDRKGETVLYGAILLGGDSLQGQLAAEVIAAFHEAGLEQAARRLAVEVALAAGL